MLAAVPDEERLAELHERARRVPTGPGVYRWRDADGRVLYVGKAANLRSRVRSYFSTDERRKIGQLLRETKAIDHHVCRNGLEAAVLEVRLIHRHLPRFNRQHTRSSKYPYVKLTLDERFPRLSVARTVKDDGAYYLGPISSTKRAKRIIEAIETAAPIRRCTARSTGTMSKPVCAAAQIGVAACPCSGSTSESDYRRLVEDLVDTLSREPDRLLRPLEERIAALALDERFEEAADVRDRAEALSGALRRARRFDLLRRAGRIRVTIGDAWAEFDRGLLVACGAAGDDALWAEGLPAPAPTLPDPGAPLGVPRRDEADELLTIVAWLERNAAKVRLDTLDGVLVEPLPRIPTFAPQGGSPAGRPTERTGVEAGRSRRSRIPMPRIL